MRSLTLFRVMWSTSGRHIQQRFEDLIHEKLRSYVEAFKLSYCILFSGLVEESVMAKIGPRAVGVLVENR